MTITAYTRVHANPAAAVMRALALRCMPGAEWRHHGIGVLQGYVREHTEPEVRIHVWSRRLLKPGMDISGDVHDHRFDMVSHVLCGTVGHEVLLPTRDDAAGSHRMMRLTHARAAADNRYHGPTEELEGAYVVQRCATVIEAGESYTFPAGMFHRSPLSGGLDDIAVTVVEKHRQRDDVQARILYPAAHPPVMAFGHFVDQGAVREVINRAISALEAMP